MHYQTGTDTSETDWELESTNGQKKRVNSSVVKDMIDVRPDWVRVVKVRACVAEEVKLWDEFSAKEAEDLAEYERLKSKFG